MDRGRFAEEALMHAWPIFAQIAPLRSAAVRAGEAYIHLAQKRPHVAWGRPFSTPQRGYWPTTPLRLFGEPRFASWFRGFSSRVWIGAPRSVSGLQGGHTRPVF